VLVTFAYPSLLSPTAELFGWPC